MKRTSRCLASVADLVLVLALILAGCATPTPIPGARRDLLTFLRVGQTTREEVLCNLGHPSASFEQERILTYQIGEDPMQRYYPAGPSTMVPLHKVRYSLVLVFDAGGLLQNQRLVKIR